MTNEQFLLAAVKLKRDTGTDIETIGMTVDTDNVHINIYGSIHEHHNMDVEQLAFIKNGLEWIDIEPTEFHLRILEKIFKREVEKVYEEKQRADQLEKERIQHAKDVERFGTAGALYSKHH